MKKVRLNESQLRRLVRGIIRESRFDDYGPLGRGGNPQRYDPLDSVNDIVTNMEASIKIDELMRDIRTGYSDEGELLANSIGKYLEEYVKDPGMMAVFETALDQLEQGDEDVALRALRSIGGKLSRMR